VNQPKDQSARNITAFATRLEQQIGHFVDGLVEDARSIIWQHNLKPNVTAWGKPLQKPYCQKIIRKPRP